MHILSHWPLDFDLGLPFEIRERLVNSLTEHFAPEAVNRVQCARLFWQHSNCHFVLLNAHEDRQTLQTLNPVLERKVQEAISNPEVHWPLGDDYQLFLCITSDDGSGLYVMLPTDSPLLAEVASEAPVA